MQLDKINLLPVLKIAEKEFLPLVGFEILNPRPLAVANARGRGFKSHRGQKLAEI